MFGSHLSIAGGLHNALLEAEKLHFDTLQIFTRNQQQWRAKPLTPEEIALWRQEQTRLGFTATVSHDSYLINLASPDDILWQKSIDALTEELRRCESLGITYLVMHPGAHMGCGEELGLARIAQGLDRVLAAAAIKNTLVCLEITAGQGSTLGYRLEHLQQIITRVKKTEQFGVCLDTAHLFAAGYDFRGPKYDAFRKELDQHLGIARVKVWHLNDSRKPLGSRVDRHDHIGEGSIGLEAFAPIVRDPAWKNIPKILETPKEIAPDGRPWDLVNLQRLKSLM